ncbi:MAG: hypothetical protein EBY09_21450, partial [Verrucomicrobia bacterium]|nr:hypothetical protein [Verrucomicrobiota bacterium]
TPRGVTPGTGWTFRDGAFYTTGTGTLGRECHLPGTVRVEFDLAWRGQPSFRFSFFTRSAEQFDSNDGWQFYVSTSGYIYPMRRTGNGAFSVNTTRVPQFLTKNSVRLSFLLDREKETALLLADGEKVYEWKGLGRPGDGTAVLFYNYNTERLTLTLDKWEGNEVSAVSPVFGRLHLPPAAVRALRFNPHVSRTSGDELNWPGDALSTRP